MVKQIGQILPQIFKQEGWKVQLLSEWNGIVGNLADKIRLEKIEGSTLTIGVYQASWLQELHLLSSVLLKTINQCLPHPYVKQLRFKRAVITKKPIIQKKQDAVKQEYRTVVLSPREKKALDTVQDEQLKEALHAFLSKCYYQKVTS